MSYADEHDTEPDYDLDALRQQEYEDSHETSTSGKSQGVSEAPLSNPTEQQVREILESVTVRTYISGGKWVATSYGKDIATTRLLSVIEQREREVRMDELEWFRVNAKFSADAQLARERLETLKENKG